MAKQSTVTLGVSVTGDGLTLGYSPQGFPLQNPNAPAGVPTSVAIVNGNNTISIPSGCIAILIQPPAGSVITKTLKGVAGDTGVPIHTANPTLLSLPSGTSSILIAANGAETLAISFL